jgi:hypothetical protein
MCSYGLQRLPRRQLNFPLLGLQGHHTQQKKPNLSLSTLPGELEGIIVAYRSQLLNLFKVFLRELK